MRYVDITYRYESDVAHERKRPANAEEARRRLDEGSRAFSQLLANLDRADATARRVIQVDPGDLGIAEGDDRAPRQRPFAAVLGCSDARVPIELIFNEGPNDLFVVRVAGNALGSDVLGSLRYAVDHLGDLRLVVVLGHSGCGAVSAAVDVFLNPAGYLSLASMHSIRGLLDRLLIVVQASAKRMAAAFGADVVDRPGYREALIEASVVTNAALAAHTIQRSLADASSDLRAVYGVYLIGSREVWAPRAGSNQVIGLAEPPADADRFAGFADAVVQSQRIASLLDFAR